MMRQSRGPMSFLFVLVAVGIDINSALLGIGGCRTIKPSMEVHGQVPICSTTSPSCEKSDTEDTYCDDNAKFREMCITVSCKDETESPRLYLGESSDGVRGVFTATAVQEGDTILSIPLHHCLRDDQPPGWMSSHESGTVNPEENDCIGWAIRLAASLVDEQSRIVEAQASNLQKTKSLWFSLFPNPSYLRASLPIHWSEDVLVSSKCFALELAVDTNFFTRANAVQDIIDHMEECSNPLTKASEVKRLAIENALDLVQTRSCRVIVDGRPVRLLAPIFDMINHHPTKVNAEFYVVEGESSLLVKALCEIKENHEIFIDYGESARPDWRCLNAYGFVPPFEPNTADGDHVAELFLEGQRFYVSPDSVSEELVKTMALAIGEADAEYDEKATLTATIALRLAQRISEAAFQILLQDDEPNSRVDNDDDEEHETETAECIISERLVASLRWNQHRILMACSLGLRDWAMNHP